MITAAIRPARTNRSPIFEWWRSVDQITLSLLLCLIAAGLILSMGTSPAASARLEYANPFNFLYRHAVFAALGLCGAILISILGATFARRIAILALVVSVALMAALPFIGYEVKGATRCRTNLFIDPKLCGDFLFCWTFTWYCTRAAGGFYCWIYRGLYGAASCARPRRPISKSREL